MTRVGEDSDPSVGIFNNHFLGMIWLTNSFNLR
jgi:hypothetical protein